MCQTETFMEVTNQGEILDAIRASAATLGRTPSRSEFKRASEPAGVEDSGNICRRVDDPLQSLEI